MNFSIKTTLPYISSLDKIPLTSEKYITNISFIYSTKVILNICLVLLLSLPLSMHIIMHIILFPIIISIIYTELCTYSENFGWVIIIWNFSIVTFLDVLITLIFSLDTLLCYVLILASNEYIHLFILVYIATNLFYSFIVGYYKIFKYLNNVLHTCM